MSSRSDCSLLGSSDAEETADDQANSVIRAGDGEFKLLSLRRGESSDPVTCDLFVASLDRSIKYDALSYVCGDPQDTKEIKLCEKPFYATANLESALRYLRYRDRERIMWVDAICINQNDPSERSLQILQMGRIYQQAEEVLAWLGTGSLEWSLAINAIERLSGNKNLHWLPPGGKAKRSPAYLKPLQQLLLSPWWNRTWILQEAVLARKLTFICGSGHLSSDSVFGIVESCTRHIGKCCKLRHKFIYIRSSMLSVSAIRSLRNSRKSFYETIKLFENIEKAVTFRESCVGRRAFLREQQAKSGTPDEPLKELLDAEQDIFEIDQLLDELPKEVSDARNGVANPQRGPKALILQKDIHIRELNFLLPEMHRHRHRDCQQGYDKIYAFLGLFSAHIKEIIIPDYRLPLSKVYSDFAFNIIQKSRTLNIFSLLLPFPSQEEHPTWVPNWADRGSLTMNNILYHRFYQSISFRASGNLFNEVTMLSDKLCVRGLVCDKIIHVVPRIELDTVEDWNLRRTWWTMLALNQRYNRSSAVGMKWMNAFCHTLLAYSSPYPSGPSCSSWWPKFCLLSKLGIFSKRELKVLMRHASNYKVLILLLWRQLLNVALEANDSICLATHTRRFFISERGYFGLAPMDARPGDQICILFGGAMPYILRETLEQIQVDSAQHNCHSLVGEAYVHGLMNGEGLDMIERQEAKAQTFFLR